jgi:D-lactate dehydrogenase
METVIYSTHKFERDTLFIANKDAHKLRLLELPLNMDTAQLAAGAEAVCLFVSDDGSGEVLQKLSGLGIKFIALRSAGFNHVDMKAAARLKMRVARVAAYSPYAIAEYAVALMLELNRKMIRANSRVHEGNFSLDGLTGFDMHGKTVGIIGTGNIGAVVAKILHGFGCRILAVDQQPDTALAADYGVSYTDYESLFQQSDIITLHLPLTPDTRYLINAAAIAKMKHGVMLINTGRGALINTKEVIAGLKTGQIGYLGLDVYEEEAGLFFEDHSDDVLQDDTISRLLSFKNVLVTSHQAFLTDTALQNIAKATIDNLDCFAQGGTCANEILPS